ncbi:unnamed protein product [Toxocara canis]|uniref:Uncharacterized protein n=1 Tax=Toxocara canis TaxID=6265 RepID=A0A3P7H2S1_TOXCA|nr:unnamed protein product [Toxocara canis]
MIRNALRAKRERGERHAAMMASIDESERGSSPASTSAAIDEMDDSGLVEQMFGFLPSEPASIPITDRKFAHLQADVKTGVLPTPSNTPPLPEAFEKEDLRGYQFGKFAATYFQGQATPFYIKKPLRCPLLLHEDAGSQLEKTSVMGRLYSTLGRSFTKKDVELASQLGDYDQVGCY